jgi:predicted NUDIX family NTP pyrophosphohydrolase
MRSAGLLLFRRGPDGLEFFLVHPGGPFFARKDAGAWTIPKGVIEPGEEPLAAACREFTEETGHVSAGPYHPLGEIVQKGGKQVIAWGCETEAPGEIIVRSNLFTIEWPPRSGRQQSFPEIDRGEFFPPTEACQKILTAQLPFLERLAALLAT